MAGETILVIDDEEPQREALAGHLKKQGYEVLTADSGQAGIDLLRGQAVDLILTDYRMPDVDGMRVLLEARRINPEVEVVMITAFGSVEGAVKAMSEGAFRYIEKPVDLDELDRMVEMALESHYRTSENRVLKAQAEEAVGFEGMISGDPAMEQALNVAARVAPSQATVLILGESGTGKELIARAIHAASPRSRGPFVPVNCGALNENLIESELFGHERGAFTGADQLRKGRFEQADGGTLFVDEVADVPLAAQVKLLRVLQERTFERVGGNTSVDVDVRLISATNRDLAGMVKEAAFREDLYYRLNVVTVQIPPLRDRREDIPLLVEHFLARYSRENVKQIQGVSREAMDSLMRYAYPGNVRELQNIVERAVVMARGDLVTRSDLPSGLAGGGDAGAGGHEAQPLPDRVSALEIREIRRVMKEANHVQRRAAALLGITERNLRYKLRKYGLK